VEEDDEETIQDNSELRALLPFAIIGSEEEIELDGQPVRASFNALVASSRTPFRLQFHLLTGFAEKPRAGLFIHFN
jgi:cell division control protein 11